MTRWVHSTHFIRLVAQISADSFSDGNAHGDFLRRFVQRHIVRGLCGLYGDEYIGKGFIGCYRDGPIQDDFFAQCGDGRVNKKLSGMCSDRGIN
mmetsp:Transcript_9292/g.17781  ORF Transcript_9292/g.17781 Transcript_9292/m.17781 type:complete len:94 (+) Transcript_9292:762-1043(+)